MNPPIENLEFNFKNRNASDLILLNHRLSSMKLLDLELENSKGYLATTKDGSGNLISHRYGFVSGTLVCTLAEDRNGYLFQIDTAVTDCAVRHEAFGDAWQSSHPEFTMRVLHTIAFDNANAHIVLYHLPADDSYDDEAAV